MRFMLMMNAPGKTEDWAVMQWPKEALHAHIQFMKKLNVQLRAEGKFVAAEGLAPPSDARIVRATDANAPMITDGPFAESKEFLAGYWIVQTDSAEEAYRIAARASCAPGKDGKPMGIPIEVRRVGDAPPDSLAD